MNAHDHRDLRVVVFDLGKVVLDFDNHLISRRIAALSGRPEEEIYRSFFDSELILAFDRGEISPEEFFREVRSALSLPLDFDAFVPLWCDIFRPVEGMEPLVRALHGRYRLGILSNTNRLHFDFIREHFPVVRLFDSHHLSCEMGRMKPDPAVYRHIVEHYGCRPEEAFFTDDIDDYVVAARDAGFAAVPFRSAEQLSRDLERYGVHAGRVKAGEEK